MDSERKASEYKISFPYIRFPAACCREDQYTFEAALKYAFKLLNYKDRSEKEMHERLNQKGFSGKVAQEAVAYLKERRFIDDERLAEFLKRGAAERRCLGKDGVRNYLLNKGISETIADKLSGDEEDYLETAKRFVEKRLRGMRNYDEETIKRKLGGLLLRRGFSYGTMHKIIKSFNLREEQK